MRKVTVTMDHFTTADELLKKHPLSVSTCVLAQAIGENMGGPCEVWQLCELGPTLWIDTLDGPYTTSDLDAFRLVREFDSLNSPERVKTCKDLLPLEFDIHKIIETEDDDA